MKKSFATGMYLISAKLYTHLFYSNPYSFYYQIKPESISIINFL